MIDTIYIPTLGRSQNQITFDNMTENAQRVTRLVVQPKEKDLYPNYPIIVLPDNDIGKNMESLTMTLNLLKELQPRRNLKNLWIRLVGNIF